MHGRARQLRIGARATSMQLGSREYLTTRQKGYGSCVAPTRSDEVVVNPRRKPNILVNLFDRQCAAGAKASWKSTQMDPGKTMEKN